MRARTTCKRCHCRAALYSIRRFLGGGRFLKLQPLEGTPSRKRHSLCFDCGTREIARRDRIDRMEPGAVAFVLANGGKL